VAARRAGPGDRPQGWRHLAIGWRQPSVLPAHLHALVQAEVGGEPNRGGWVVAEDIQQQIVDDVGREVPACPRHDPAPPSPVDRGDQIDSGACLARRDVGPTRGAALHGLQADEEGQLARLAAGSRHAAAPRHPHRSMEWWVHLRARSPVDHGPMVTRWRKPLDLFAERYGVGPKGPKIAGLSWHGGPWCATGQHGPWSFLRSGTDTCHIRLYQVTMSADRATLKVLATSLQHVRAGRLPRHHARRDRPPSPAPTASARTAHASP